MDGGIRQAAAAAWVVSRREAVHGRLADVESFAFDAAGASRSADAALPAGYRTSGRRLPLVVLLGTDAPFGAAAEMSRLLAGSREAAPCIVVHAPEIPAADAAQIAALVAECGRRYRVDAAGVALFACNGSAPDALRTFMRGVPGVARCIVGTFDVPASLAAWLPGSAGAKSGVRIAWTVATSPEASLRARADVKWTLLPEATEAGLAVPAFINGLRAFWGTTHDYGAEVLPLARPWVGAAARALSPLLRRIAPRPTFAPETSRHVLRATALGRDFEVFVSMPEGALRNPARRYPALIALDANAGFATVCDIVQRLARAGEIDDTIVVGIGVPRSQGNVEFGFRRFEEMAPPAREDYAWDDALGRFFRALFWLRGQDVRAELGRAPGFHDFIARQVVPQLVAQCQADPGALALLGHSAAGTFVAYALAQPESPFSAFLCLSPGVAIGGDWMLGKDAMPPPRPVAPRVFLALGADELRNRFNQVAGIPRTLEYVEALRRHLNPAVPCHVLAGETHTTVYARALAQGLNTLLRPRRGR